MLPTPPGRTTKTLGRLVGFDLDSLFQNQQLTQNSFRTIESIEPIEPIWVRHGTRARPYYATPFWRAYWGGKWTPEKCKCRQIRFLPSLQVNKAAPRTHVLAVPSVGLASVVVFDGVGLSVTSTIGSHAHSQETLKTLKRIIAARLGATDEALRKGMNCIATPRAPLSRARHASESRGRAVSLAWRVWEHVDDEAEGCAWHCRSPVTRRDAGPQSVTRRLER
jgi:hypothetical protein